MTSTVRKNKAKTLSKHYIDTTKFERLLDLHRLRHAHLTRAGAGEDTGGKPVFGVIGKAQHLCIRLEALDELLDAYYSARGWDENGIPTEKTLVRVGLTELMKL